MPSLSLYFESAQLVKTVFHHEIIGEEIKAVRGKTAGAHGRVGTFQWTSAVQAMVILLLKVVSTSLSESGSKGDAPVLSGLQGSLAASLDYAIGKGVVWLGDILGCDSSGLLLAKRIFLRSNSNLRRPGPVLVSLNSNFLSAEAVSVYINGNRVFSAPLIEQLITTIIDSTGHQEVFSPIHVKIPQVVEEDTNSNFSEAQFNIESIQEQQNTFSRFTRNLKALLMRYGQ